MHPASWQFNPSAATLHLDALSAELDSSRPHDGLTGVIVRRSRFAQSRLLGIALGQAVGASTPDPVDRYVRGADMIVVYEESERWPLRIDAVWRAVAPAAPTEFLAAVDLIVSVRTHLLDMRPDLAVASVIPSCDVLRLSGSRSASSETLPLSDKEPTVLKPDAGPSCLLFRIPGVDFSYVEMVHPADFQHDELSRSVSAESAQCAAADAAHCGAAVPAALRITHRLFRTNLEKGVILRARVRGVFVDRTDDVGAAAACYTAFAAADPPLGT